jgi:hypothetical protein
MICYITFSADGHTKEYAYTCGGLLPIRGDLIVITVGKDNHYKIVPCTRTALEDPLAIKEIFGIVQTQPRTNKDSL